MVKKILKYVILVCTISLTACSQNTKDTMEYNKLTPEEERVIVHKGTEAPFKGEYDNFWGEGIYVCRRCNAPLYRSSDKFDAHCGWPSFDDEIPGAVKRIPDDDGVRTEIECANCGAHVGHVFIGEGMTPKNTRHCVNSISLKFVPFDSIKNAERAIFAGGCFWGTEYMFQKVKGVLSTVVGYTGGHTEHPTYKQACSDTTGHAEAIEILFDPKQTSYRELCKLFFEIHDPTKIDRQGPDIGEQYRTAIFYTNDEQKQIAEELIDTLKAKGFKVATEVTKSVTFWKAEEYHQDYYKKNGGQPYCHFYRKRF